jgi:hypothetical protein
MISDSKCRHLNGLDLVRAAPSDNRIGPVYQLEDRAPGLLATEPVEDIVATEDALAIGGGRLGQDKDLYHTVKSHSVANSGTNSGCSISKASVACGLYPILEYHFFRKSLLG